jgi:transposase
MKDKRKSYSKEDKLSLLRDYYQSGLSKNSFCKSRRISAIKSLNTWLKVFANEKELLSLQSELANITDMANRSKESYQEENAQLKQRIKELEKALAFSKLETEARDLMITRAEEYFDIPIRKKTGAK